MYYPFHNAQNLGVDAEYMELLDTQNAMKIAVQNMYKIKSWREPKSDISRIRKNIEALSSHD